MRTQCFSRTSVSTNTNYADMCAWRRDWQYKATDTENAVFAFYLYRIFSSP